MTVIASLLQGIAGIWFLRLKNGPPLTTRQRADAVQRVCAMTLHRLSIRLEIHGDPPPSGLLVANHLSYLDVLAFGASTPCVFISKIEVLRWPIFGLAGAVAGSVFVDRSKSAAGGAATARVEQILREGVCVLLFAEGTSTDGSHVLPFYSSFFEPAVLSQSVVTTAAIAYPDGPGFVEKDICYYDDLSFMPRLFASLCLHGVVARLDFSPHRVVYTSRKIAATSSREEIIQMRNRQSHPAVVAEDQSSAVPLPSIAG